MSAFAGMSTEQLQAALAAAQQSLIDLMTGRAAVTLSYTQGDGAKSITRRITTPAECRAIILELQRALGMPEGRRRAFRPTYR